MNNFRDVVLTQKSELEDQLRRSYVERQLPPQAVTETSLIRVIIGPRRAGKSTLANHLLQKLGGGGYANFDDERLADLSDADALIAAIDGEGNRDRLFPPPHRCSGKSEEMRETHRRPYGTPVG